MKNLSRWVIVGRLGVSSLLLAGAYACSSGRAFEAFDAVASERGALTACPTGSCTGGKVCCAGFCVSPPGGKLAFLTNGVLDYSCYAAQAGQHFASPQANNILPDFSHAGYRGGGVWIPPGSPAASLSADGDQSDDSARIQLAINAIPAVASNWPSQVLTLGPGTYYIDTPLKIRQSRVVLRGSGQGTNGTILKSRIANWHSLIEIEPATALLPYPSEISGTQRKITSPSVPVGSKTFTIQGSGFAQGDEIVVVRTPNRKWLQDIHMDGKWVTSNFVVRHPRKITGVSTSGGNQTLTIDIPMVDSIESVYGGGEGATGIDNSAGYVAKLGPGGFIEESGVENLRIDAQYEDEDPDGGHWVGVRLTRTRNSWVKKVTVKKYGMSAVMMAGWSNFNTVEEVAHVDPKSPLNPPPPQGTGLPVNTHRYSFWVSEGIGNLFQRCYTRDSRHSFVTGSRVPGPNVWLDSVAINVNAEEGPHLNWATGLLYDNIHTEASALASLGEPPNGGVRAQNVGGSTSHGWTGAQVMIWNCQAPLVADAPAGGMNWVVGGIGFPYEGRTNEAWGIWQLSTTTVKPRSLYHTQLIARGAAPGDPPLEAITSEQQRNGRIWQALKNWAGEGSLDDYYPDPECLRGIEVGRRCLLNFVANNRSCAHYPPPCDMPSPNCEGGVDGGDVCCASSCVQCGGGNCSGPPNNPPGSAANCCDGNITASGRSCLEYPPPCVKADPNCVNGVQGNTTCCHASCTQCGGTGCASGANTPENCCGGTISASGRTCNEYVAPCTGAAPIIEQ